MEARIGKVVLIAGALSMAWIAVGPSPGSMTAMVADLVTGQGISLFGYEVRVSVQVTRPDQARDRDKPRLACLVDTGLGTLLVFDPRVFGGDHRATRTAGHKEEDW
jgi:hypothetical protein